MTRNGLCPVKNTGHRMQLMYLTKITVRFLALILKRIKEKI